MRRMAENAAKDATVESNPRRLREATNPDLLTVAAIAIVATVIADFIHEGLGHGGMCVATSGRPLVLSTVHFECSPDTRLVAAGGTLANLIFGALFWAAARAVKQSALVALLLLAADDVQSVRLRGDIFCSPASATSATGQRSWRDGSRRGRGAWAWLRSGTLLISFCLCLCACANCVRS